MVSTRPVISNSSSPCINPLVTVSRAPITIGIIVIFMFHSFLNSLARSRYLSFFSHSFTLWSAGTAKFIILQVLFFCWYDLVVWFSDPFASRIRSLWVSFSWADSGLCIYHLFIWSNFNFLHNTLWITLIKLVYPERWRLGAIKMVCYPVFCDLYRCMRLYYLALSGFNSLATNTCISGTEFLLIFWKWVYIPILETYSFQYLHWQKNSKLGKYAFTWWWRTQPTWSFGRRMQK